MPRLVSTRSLYRAPAESLDASLVSRKRGRRRGKRALVKMLRAFSPRYEYRWILDLALIGFSDPFANFLVDDFDGAIFEGPEKEGNVECEFYRLWFQLDGPFEFHAFGGEPDVRFGGGNPIRGRRVRGEFLCVGFEGFIGDFSRLIF